MTPDRDAATKVWLIPALAGMAATLTGIGIARFSYTPILPALIEAGWFGADDAAYIGAANLIGYLAGAAGGRHLGHAFPPHRVVPLMMLLAAVSFFACMSPGGFVWFFVWRFLSGVTGGVIMVLAASLALARVPAARRGLAGGIVFTGVGIGIAIGGAVVPALIPHGLPATWASLGALSLAATVAVWIALPAAPAPFGPAAPAPGFGPPALIRLHIVYALIAFGLVAPMVFLADYAARGLGLGLAAGGLVWIGFGAGALIGALFAGRVADKIGFAHAIGAVLVLEVGVGLLIPLAGGGAPLYVVSFAAGALVPGSVPLVLGRVQELADAEPSLQQRAWSHATIAFSVGQAAGAYGLSAVFAATGRHDLLFFIGAGAAALALVLHLAPTRRA